MAATVPLHTLPDNHARCPVCATPHAIIDERGSEFFVCEKCSNLIRFESGDIPVRNKKITLPKLPPLLEPGTKGHLEGFDFTVTGYLEKTERGTSYSWREYILYNPEKGYATLSEYAGHWNFVAGKNLYPDIDNITESSNALTYNGIKCTLFNKYVAKCNAACGEFEWDVFADRPNIREYVSAPFMIFEESGGEHAAQTNFYLGTYLEPEAVAAAFNLNPGIFPKRNDVGANQPSPHMANWQKVFQFTGIAVIALLVIQLVTISLKPRQTIFAESFNVPHGTATTGEEKGPFKTASFKLDEQTAALEINVQSTVTNHWMEAGIVLVKEQTNETWEINETVEYYEGYEDGESWKEGSKETTAMLSSIPQGTYHLNIYPATDSKDGENLRIVVAENPTLWMNLFIVLLILLLYPAYCWIRMRNFEKRRWSNSDYSPFVPLNS